MNDLTVIEDKPADLMRNATDIAGLCKSIVVKSAIQIQNKKYVPIEGWMSIATAHGCCLSAGHVEAIEGGIRAVGEVRRVKDGVLIATAEGFVGEDEHSWASRPVYARRAMAQTRAMSRAARSVFAHVVMMMDSGLATTPAEEVPAAGYEAPAAAATTAQQALCQEAAIGEQITPDWFDAAKKAGGLHEVDKHLAVLGIGRKKNGNNWFFISLEG